MVELTLEQQQAIAIARAKRLRAEAQNTKLESEISQRSPMTADTSFDKMAGAQDKAPEAVDQNIQNNQTVREMRSGRYDPVTAAGTLGVGLAKGAANAGLNTLGLAAAGGDLIGNAIGNVYDEYAPSIGLSPRNPEGVAAGRAQNDRNIKALQDATFEPSNPSERLTIPAGEIATGMALGGGATSGLAGRVAQLGTKLARTGGFLTKAAGAEFGAATAMDKDNKGLVVGDGSITGLGLKPEEGDTEADKTVKQAINLGFDNVITALGLGGAAKGIGGAAGFANTIRKNIFGWRDLDKINRDMTESIMEIGLNIPANASKKEWLAAHDKIIEKLRANGNKTYEMGDGINDVNVNRDTVSILKDNLDMSDPVQRAKAKELEQMRAGAELTSPKTQIALDQQKEGLNRTLQNIDETRGGDAAIDQTRINLQNKARQEAAQQDVGVQNAKDDLMSEQNDLQSALENDPTFKSKIESAKDNKVNLDVAKESRELKDKLLDKTTEGLEADNKARDAVHKKIIDSGADADPSFMETYEEVKDTLPESIKNIIEKSDGSYGYLYEKVKPALNRFEAKAKYNPTIDLDGSRALSRNIRNDQLAALTESGEHSTAQAAIDAQKFEMDYGQRRRQGIGEQLRNNYRDAMPTKKGMLRPDDYRVEGRNILTTSIKDPNRREYVKKLSELAGPEDDHLIGDIALAESMQDIVAGKGANINKITSDLQQMASAFPEAQQRRIEGYLTDLKRKGATIDDLKARIPELEKTAEQAKDKIYMGKFRNLFDKEFGAHESVEDSLGAFRKTLLEPENSKVKQLIDEAKKDPNDLAGLQAAWSKVAKETFGRNQKDIVELPQGLKQSGRELFGDKIFDSIQTLRDDAKKLLDERQGAKQAVLNASENTSAAHGAVNLVLTWVFGVLNPTAARARTIVSNMAKKYDSKNLAHQSVDELLSNSQKFADEYQKIIDKQRNKLTPAQRQMLFRFGVNLGLNLRGDVNHQTDKATELPKLKLNTQ